MLMNKDFRHYQQTFQEDILAKVNGRTYGGRAALMPLCDFADSADLSTFEETGSSREKPSKNSALVLVLFRSYSKKMWIVGANVLLNWKQMQAPQSGLKP